MADTEEEACIAEGTAHDLKLLQIGAPLEEMLQAQVAVPWECNWKSADWSPMVGDVLKDPVGEEAGNSKPG